MRARPGPVGPGQEGVRRFPRPAAAEASARRFEHRGNVVADSHPAVRTRPGGFYEGWITSDLAGRLMGVPGSMGW